MNHQQSKLEETGVKTAAVADGVENSLQHIGGIREKMDVLGQSGSAIRDVVEGLSQSPNRMQHPQIVPCKRLME